MATVGSAAPSQNTINYDALLTTTLMNYRAVMVDNIFKSSAYLAALREFGGVDYQDGGERIQALLMYEQNDTVKSYRGYDTLSVKPQDGMTSAFFEWGQIGGTISISRREERQNSGKSQIMNLLKQKIVQLEMSMKAETNSQLILGTVSSSTFVPGNSSKDLFPLGYFLRKAPRTDPVSGGNVGNISASTYEWWRALSATLASASPDTGNSFALAVTTYKGLKVGLYRMYNFCSHGADGSPPNLITTDQVTFETYENSLDQDKRYGNEKLVSMGFDNVKLKGATMIWDEKTPDVSSGTAAITYGTAFFENTKFSKLVIDTQTDFITTPFVSPENQDAKTAKMLFMGNKTSSNPRKCGVCYGISQTIAA